MSEAPGPGAPRRVRIWDWPTRAFHWLLVLLIPALWWTAEYERTELHLQLGIVMLGLVLFRILWGFLGGSTARFTHFLKGPRGIAAYLSGRVPNAVGHNPLGGWSVLAMLVLLVVQVGLGLFASDEDGLYMGPLSLWLSEDTVETITDLHETLFNVLLALIVLHVAAILFYTLFRRQNLIGPMVTGSGEAPESAAPMQSAPAWRLLLALGIAIGAAAWLWTRL